MADATELETWVRDELSVPATSSVIISEQPGRDPRCSPVVTEVRVVPAGDDELSGGYAFHIEQALADATRMDVIAALAFGGGH